MIACLWKDVMKNIIEVIPLLEVSKLLRTMLPPGPRKKALSSWLTFGRSLLFLHALDFPLQKNPIDKPHKADNHPVRQTIFFFRKYWYGNRQTCRTCSSPAGRLASLNLRNINLFRKKTLLKVSIKPDWTRTHNKYVAWRYYHPSLAQKLCVLQNASFLQSLRTGYHWILHLFLSSSPPPPSLYLSLPLSLSLSLSLSLFFSLQIRWIGHDGVENVEAVDQLDSYKNSHMTTVVNVSLRKTVV